MVQVIIHHQTAPTADLVDQVVVVVMVILLVVMVDLLQDLELETLVVLVMEQVDLMVAAVVAVVPVELVRQELPLMLDMEVQEYKHLQRLDLLPLVRVYLDLHMDHHLVAHGSLVVVEEEPLHQSQELLEVDHQHLIYQTTLDGLVQELEVKEEIKVEMPEVPQDLVAVAAVIIVVVSLQLELVVDMVVLVLSSSHIPLDK